MAGARAGITIEDAEVNAALARVEAAGGDTTALMAEISAAMLFSVQRRFERETDPEGKPWSPLKPRTVAQRAKGRGNSPRQAAILRDSGRLYGSVTPYASAAEAAVGTNLDYAGVHQGGATITQYAQSRVVPFRKVGRRRQFARRAHKRVEEQRVTFGQRTIVIPARRYLGFSEEDRAELLLIAEDHYRRATEGRS